LSRHYLDHASSSTLRPEGRAALLEWLDRTADPGRVHTEGRMVRAAIEVARAQVADLLGVRSRAVVFTSGATEAANTAVWGAAAAQPGGRSVLAPVEHSCVRQPAARAGEITHLPVDRVGRLPLEALQEALDDEGGRPVSLVHCQWGNHEVGTVQPVAEVVAACRRVGVLVHVDAAQAVGRLPELDLGELGADLVSVSAHKFGGPAGIGALVIRRGLRLEPLLLGGDQERARRAGMENVAAIAGFGAVAEALGANRRARLQLEADTARRRIEALRRVALAVDGVVVYGDEDPAGRLPHLLCLGIDGVEAEAVLLGLDQAGIAAHSGSACSSEALEPSPVLEAMGVDGQRSLRLSVGWSTTDADVSAFGSAFPAVVGRLRALGARPA